jgi:tetratricopeptide (TPR) repeat protein
MYWMPQRPPTIESASLPDGHVRLRNVPHAKRARNASLRVQRPLDSSNTSEHAGNSALSVFMCRLILLCLLELGVVAAQAPKLTPEAEEFIGSHFQDARSAEAREQFTKAIEEYELILQRYPKAVPEVYQNLGLVYYLLRQYDDAIRVFERGIRLKPAMIGARLFLGNSYLAMERPQEALPHLQYAYSNQPNAESAKYLGMCLNSLRRYDEANKYYRVALNLSDDKSYYLHLLGNSYLKLSEQVGNKLTDRYPNSKFEYAITAKVVDAQQWYQIAAKEYLEAAKRDAMNASLFFPLARWLAVLGKDKASEMAFDRYRRLLPQDKDAKINRAELPKKEMADVGITVDYEAELAALPKVNTESLPPVPMLPAEANEELQKKIAAQPGGKWKEAAEHIVNSRYQKATESLEALRPGPNDWLRDYLLASVWLWREDAGKAEDVARRLPRIAETPVVQMLRWDIYHQLSFIYFQRLLDEYPQSAWAHFLRGRTLNSQGKLQAEQEYLAAIAADPNLPEVHIALADVYLSNSKIEEALAECRKELELNAHSSAAKVRIGRIYVQMREAEKGIPYLEEALRADPDDANARVDLAQGMELRGDTDKAIAEYERALKADPSLNRIHYILARLYRKTGKRELAERQYQVFNANEATARQQSLERLRRLREAETLKTAAQ